MISNCSSDHRILVPHQHIAGGDVAVGFEHRLIEDGMAVGDEPDGGGRIAAGDQQLDDILQHRAPPFLP